MTYKELYYKYKNTDLVRHVNIPGRKISLRLDEWFNHDIWTNFYCLQFYKFGVRHGQQRKKISIKMTFKQLQEKYKNLEQDFSKTPQRLYVFVTHNNGTQGWINFYKFGVRHGQHRFTR